MNIVVTCFRCCNLWKIEDLKNYKFSTFRGAVDINCKIDENTGIVLFLQIKPNQGEYDIISEIYLFLISAINVCMNVFYLRTS